MKPVCGALRSSKGCGNLKHQYWPCGSFDRSFLCSCDGRCWCDDRGYIRKRQGTGGVLACVEMSTYNSSPPFGAVDGNSRRSHAPVGLCSVVLLAFDVARAGTIVCQRTLGKGIVFLPISNWGIEISPGRNDDRRGDMFLVQPGKVLASFLRFWVWAGEFSLGGEFSTQIAVYGVRVYHETTTASLLFFRSFQNTQGATRRMRLFGRKGGLEAMRFVMPRNTCEYRGKHIRPGELVKPKSWWNSR